MTSENYSLENARKYGWSSVGDSLHPARREIVDAHVLGRSVLDAGCAGGGYVRYFHDRGWDAVGVDLHDEFLDQARDQHPECEFYQGSIDSLPFDENRFDTTICFDVLEHVADDRSAMIELARVSKKRLVIAVPMEDNEMTNVNLTFLHYQDVTHVRYYTESGLQSQLGQLFPTAEIQIIPHLAIPRIAAAGQLIGDDVGRGISELVSTAQTRRWKRWLWRAATGALPSIGLNELLAGVTPPSMPTALAAVIDFDASDIPIERENS